MSDSLRSSTARALPVLPDTGKAKQAKASITSRPETGHLADVDWMALIGEAIQRAVKRVGWSNKEAAAKVGVDDAEFGKWLSGGRRAQFDKLLALEALRWPLIVALADVSGAAEEIVTLKRRTG